MRQEGAQDESGFVNLLLDIFQDSVQHELKVGAERQPGAATTASQRVRCICSSPAPSRPLPPLIAPCLQHQLVPRAAQIGQGLSAIGQAAQNAAAASSEERWAMDASLHLSARSAAAHASLPLPASTPWSAADSEYAQAQAELQRLSNLIQVSWREVGRRLAAVGGGWAGRLCSCELALKHGLRDRPQ